ncbi:Transmembrane protein [Melia azedarach]|uniref:Transmembrane protein n=1 Tax=Melia azedarach TaxID=155640 RepID=A0ACC1XJV7_MELAZ|nr:Transmembrane protein [Melia azedarach]
MESSIPLSKKLKLEVLGILKAALAIPSTNTDFFLLTLIISLPLFCFLIYYESFLLDILLDIFTSIQALPANHYYFNYFDYWPLGILVRLIPASLNQEFAFKLIRLSLLYLLPLHLLEFFIVLITVDLASKIYTREEERITTLSVRELLRKPPINKDKLRSTFITSVCVLFFSTSTLLGLLWLVVNYYVYWENFFYDVLFAVLYGAAFLALLGKYLEWSALWNMSLVISILEDAYGVEALALAAYFNRGSEKRGLLLMLVFLVWGVVLRLPCLFLGIFGSSDGGYGIVLQVFLLCLGNVFKWVACMIYYYDSKQRILEKKVDEETGLELKQLTDECS